MHRLKFLTSFFSVAVLSLATLWIPPAHAETSGPQTPQMRELEHSQRPDGSDSQVHAWGVAPNPSESFVERYAPPEDFTTYNHGIDWLFRYTSWVCLAFFIIVAGSLGWFIYAYREKPGRRAFYTHGLRTGNKMVTKSLDLAVFLSLDVVLMVNSYLGVRDIVWKYPTGPDTIKVQVMPQQWVWNFRYPGPDGVFGTPDDVTTINELVLPRGKPVLFEIQAKDVIHGFMVPNARIQVDALPGIITRLWFDANKNGAYEIACYHHCGTAHYKMKAFLTVVEEPDYKKWTAEMSEWSQAKYDPDDKDTHWGWKWGS